MRKQLFVAFCRDEIYKERRLGDEESHFFQESFQTNGIFKARPWSNRIETRPGFFCPPRYPWIEPRENERDF